MTQGSIIGQLIGFAIPMMLGLLFQQFYNTVDTIVVGRFVGKEALAAVGSVGNVMNMLVGFSAGLFNGAGVIISQRYGAHDHQKLHTAVHTTLTIALIFCVVFTILGILLVDPMLHLMATPDDVYASSKQYLTIYYAGISGLMLYNMGSGILRAVGDSRRPLYILIFSALVNIVGDLVFVVTFSMGVAGVAYATLVAQALSAAIVLFLLTKEKSAYGIRWNKLCMDKETIRSIVSIGLPSGIQQAITSFSNVFVQSYINHFGSSCMAGWAGYHKVDAFAMLPVQAVAMGSTTFVGQNYGAGKMDRARKGVKTALSLSISVTVAVSILMMILARPLLSLFSTDPEVIAYGQKFIWLISPFCFTICFNQIFSGALRGTGDAKTPMYILLFSFVLFRQIYLFVAKLLGNRFVMIGLAYPAGWVVASLLLIFHFRKSILGKKSVSALQN